MIHWTLELRNLSAGLRFGRGPTETPYTESTLRSHERGLSLVEVLVLIAVLSVTLAAFSSLQSSQRRLIVQLADKIASIDLARSLTVTLKGGGACTAMLTGSVPYTFDPMNLSAVNIPSFGQIPSSGLAGAVPAVIADGSTMATPGSPRLAASSIRIQNLSCASLPCSATSNQFTGDLVIGFDGTRAAGPVSPIRLPLFITTTGGAGAQTLSACTLGTGAGSGGGGGVSATIDRIVVESSAESCGGSPTHPNCNFTPPFVYATCPAGYQLTGCGYRMSLFSPQVSGAPPPWNNFHDVHPDNLLSENNSCKVDAGGNPGCGVCFKAQAICLRVL